MSLFHHESTFQILSFWVRRVCVCVWEREREREWKKLIHNEIPVLDSGSMKHKIHKNCNTVKWGCIHCKEEKRLLTTIKYFCTKRELRSTHLKIFYFYFILSESILEITHWQENCSLFPKQHPDCGSIDRASHTWPTIGKTSSGSSINGKKWSLP